MRDTDRSGKQCRRSSKVKGARRLQEITYDEMLELATLGAQVLNNRSVEMAKKYNVEVPITEQVNQVLFEGRSAKDAVTSLLMRNRTSECDWS